MDPISGTIIAFLSLSLVIMTWLSRREDHVRRDDDHAFLLSVINRIKANTAIEAEQADAYRDYAKAEVDRKDGIQMMLDQEVESQRTQGFPHEIALARAAMKLADFDPDDDADVDLYNSRIDH